MKIENLVIGKEYYLDNSKIETGIYIGKKEKRMGIFFMPTCETSYLKEKDGSVGFMDRAEWQYGLTSENKRKPVSHE